jgi:hypothetical protein
MTKTREQELEKEKEILIELFNKVCDANGITAEHVRKGELWWKKYIREGFKLGIQEGKAQAIAEEIEFLNYILIGNGYTKEYYIKMLEERLAKLQSPRETQDKGESPISGVPELDNSEYAKKGLSKHKPEDTIPIAEVMKIIDSIEIDYPDDDGLPFEQTAEEFKKELKAKLQEIK